jgi:hypothetical protein
MTQPRVFITTDLGGNDKDDAQSLIHTLLYADELDIRGIGYTLIGDEGANPHRHAKAILDAYAADRPNLAANGGDWPTRAELQDVTYMGETDKAWPGPVSPAARAIIAEAGAASPDDPLYLLSWGPSHDLMRALHEAPSIVPNVRLITIDGFGQSAPTAPSAWLADAIEAGGAYRDVWWIDHADGSFRGMYVGPKGQNDPTIHAPWVEENVAGHGALGALFAGTYPGGGIRTKEGLKMGDTPSLLYLLDDVDDDDPGARSWGGSFERNGLGPNTWGPRDGEAMGRYEGARTVYEHRSDIFEDFAMRLDWARDGAPGGESPTPAPLPAPLPAPDRAEAPAGRGDAAPIGPGLTEVEALDLSGYMVERQPDSSAGAGVRVAKDGDGSAAGVFAGAAGSYEITVGYLNESDGASAWRLLVDGVEAAAWTGRGGADAIETVSVSAALEAGDAIVLEGASGNHEYARLDWLRIEPETSGARSAPRDDAPQATPAPAPAPQAPAPRQDSDTGRDAGRDLDLDADLFVFAGQSNAAGHFYRRGGDRSGDELGARVFERGIEAWSGEDARVVNVAVSGSGSNQHADRKDYWWDLEADRPGPELVRAVQVMRKAEASGRDVDAFIWAQGEDDARSVGGGTSQGVAMQRLDAATRAIFDHVRDSLGDPDLPIFVQELGAFPQTGGWLDGPAGALDAARAVQAGIVRDMDDVHLGARTRDVGAHHDSIHFSNAGYGVIADRLADSVIDVLSDEFLF